MRYTIQCLSIYYQAKIIESRWVIGPRSGQLKARFVGKGYTQIIDKESKYAHTPQATTLKIILLMSQIHKWSLCVCQMWPQHFSTQTASDRTSHATSNRTLRINTPRAPQMIRHFQHLHDTCVNFQLACLVQVSRAKCYQNNRNPVNVVSATFPCMCSLQSLNVPPDTQVK